MISPSLENDNSGLEADQRVLTAHGVYSLTATTGLTAQNTLGVQDIHVVPSKFVRKQIDAALQDVGADVVKLGEQRFPMFVGTSVADLVVFLFIKGCSPARRPWMKSRRR